MKMSEDFTADEAVSRRENESETFDNSASKPT